MRIQSANEIAHRRNSRHSGNCCLWQLKYLWARSPAIHVVTLVSRALRRFHRKQLSVDDASEYNWVTSITAPGYKNKISIWDARKVGCGAISFNFIFRSMLITIPNCSQIDLLQKHKTPLELAHLSTFASRTICFNVIRDEITFYM